MPVATASFPEESHPVAPIYVDLTSSAPRAASVTPHMAAPIYSDMSATAPGPSAPAKVVPVVVPSVASIPVTATVAAPTVAPSAAGVAPSAPAVVPSAAAVSPIMMVPGDGNSLYLPSPTALELGALMLARFIEEGTGLFASRGHSSDESAFDDAAARELQRITFMRRLAQMHDAEDEREFSDKLSLSLRKREFLQSLETTHELLPNPYPSDRR